MKRVLILALTITLSSFAFGQQRRGQAPPLLDCGVHGSAEVICGTQAPEDLELTPDGKSLIVSPYITFRGGPNSKGIGMQLFDPAQKTFTPIPMSAEPLGDWGDKSCPGPIGDGLGPHGTSLKQRADGKWQLYVVNHAGRQSIEMFELKQAGAGWALVWHGCVVGTQEFNDVAAMPDGGFVATHPTGLGGGGNAFSGQPTGFIVRWSPGGTVTELPGTRSAYPNGLVAGPDGRSIYFAAYTTMEVHKYDVQQAKDTGAVKLGFLPDNLTWTAKGQLLAAGIKGARGNCPAESSTPCTQVFGVALVNPADLTAKTVFDSEDKGSLIDGVSVALQFKDSVYVGSFQGNRLVTFRWME